MKERLNRLVAIAISILLGGNLYAQITLEEIQRVGITMPVIDSAYQGNNKTGQPGGFPNPTGSKAGYPVIQWINTLDILVLPSTVSPGSVTQSENSVFINPVNTEVILNSNNSTSWPPPPYTGASGLFSNDAGVSWDGNEVSVGGFGNNGDPATAIDLNGNYYIGFIDNSFEQSVAISQDNGLNWNLIKVGSFGLDENFLDKNHLWVDNHKFKLNGTTNLNSNNLYSAWTAFKTGFTDPQDIFITRSTNQGLNWDIQQNISNSITGPVPRKNQGVNIQTGPNGEVYACWAVSDEYDYTCFEDHHKSEIVNRQSEIVNISTHPKGIYLVKVIQVYPVGRDDRIGVEKVYIKKLIHQ